MATRSNKRQKTEGGEEQALQELVAVQERINDMDKELAEKMLELTREYTAKKAPLYAERQDVAEAIPNFWSKVLLSWPPIEDILCDEDEDALKYLTGVMFEEREAPEEYKLVFTFASNPYFSDTQLWKVISTAGRPEADQDDEDGEDQVFGMGAHAVEASGIRWKNTEQAQALKSRVDAALGENQEEDDDDEDSAGGSIFMLFHPNDPNAEIVELIRTEVFQDPTSLYSELDDIEEEL